MRQLAALTLGFVTLSSAMAHHPQRKCSPATNKVDVFDTVGAMLPAPYRWKYNRPTNWGGRLAYWFEPSSQEAMVWHDATHRGYYADDRPRIEKHFFYPKPWESIRRGPRTAGENAVPPAPVAEPAEMKVMPIPAEEPQPIKPVPQEKDAVPSPSDFLPAPKLTPAQLSEPLQGDLGLLE